MKIFSALILVAFAALNLAAQTVPQNPEKLPTTINPAKRVHFVSVLSEATQFELAGSNC